MILVSSSQQLETPLFLFENLLMFKIRMSRATSMNMKKPIIEETMKYFG